MPIKIYCDNHLAWECAWDAGMRPVRLVNKSKGTTYTWIYNNNSDYLPVRIEIQGFELKRLNLTSGVWGDDKERFLVAYDQVGTLRGLINSRGRVVKRLDYDSFGNVIHDTLPEFFIPQGFAGGMTDRFALYLRKARASPNVNGCAALWIGLYRTCEIRLSLLRPSSGEVYY